MAKQENMLVELGISYHGVDVATDAMVITVSGLMSEEAKLFIATVETMIHEFKLAHYRPIVNEYITRLESEFGSK